MVVPVWLGYFMLTAFSLSLVVMGLFLLSGLASLILDEIIPRVWLYFMKLRLRRFDQEQIENYLDSLYQEWYEIQREENQKREDKK